MTNMERAMNMKDEEKLYKCFEDTAVSYYHSMNKNPALPNPGSWDEFFSDFLSGEVGYGSYLNYALAWEKHMDDPNVFIVTYEELKETLLEPL
ncbi:sulfotransferase 6B1-like [Clarias magur]|uniref:Sulfotransferase n=1 Tax=Clarias magur TaxID=1594786 RepID=A0A8J4UGE3_CLAMG|nr:sulfotransferase 6B1-like [Clarias magur]